MMPAKLLSFFIALFFTNFSFGQHRFFINDTLTLAEEGDGHCWSLIYAQRPDSLLTNTDLAIREAGIREGYLKLNFTYGGGCGTSHFKLLTDTSGIQALSRLDLYIDFKDEDMCEAMFYKKACFDLNPLREKIKKPVTIKIATYEDTLFPK